MTQSKLIGTEAPPRARFADVAVNTGQPARTPFTYAVPPDMPLSAGQAVFVPFGPRVLQGIVLRLRSDSDVEQVRAINAVADAAPVLDQLHIDLVRWLSDAYLSPLWDCVAACLPTGYGQKAVTMVSPVDVPPLLPIYPKDAKILQFIAVHGRSTVESMRESLGRWRCRHLKGYKAKAI